MSFRTHPNILVCGTPGTGKSSLCKKLAKKAESLVVVDFGKEAQAQGCREEYDSTLECWVIDEEKVSDRARKQICYLLTDWHSSSSYQTP